LVSRNMVSVLYFPISIILLSFSKVQRYED
jgi:hypothetical protein